MPINDVLRPADGNRHLSVAVYILAWSECRKHYSRTRGLHNASVVWRSGGCEFTLRHNCQHISEVFTPCGGLFSPQTVWRDYSQVRGTTKHLETLYRALHGTTTSPRLENYCIITHNIGCIWWGQWATGRDVALCTNKAACVVKKIAVEMLISTPLSKIDWFYTLFCNPLVHTAHTVLNLDYHSHVSLVKMHINSMYWKVCIYKICFKW